MCGVTRWHRTLSEELERRVDVPCIIKYIHRRRLRWAGHVARMDATTRLPRKLLTAWVTPTPGQRVEGKSKGRLAAPYAAMVEASLMAAGFNKSNPHNARNWREVAQNRKLWEEIADSVVNIETKRAAAGGGHTPRSPSSVEKLERAIAGSEADISGGDGVWQRGGRLRKRTKSSKYSGLTPSPIPYPVTMRSCSRSPCLRQT